MILAIGGASAEKIRQLNIRSRERNDQLNERTGENINAKIRQKIWSFPEGISGKKI